MAWHAQIQPSMAAYRKWPRVHLKHTNIYSSVCLVKKSEYGLMQGEKKSAITSDSVSGLFL